MAKRAPQENKQQSTKPEAQGKPAEGQKPEGQPAMKRKRLTPEEAREKRIERDKRLIEKAAMQAEARAKKEKLALERQAKAQARLEAELNREPKVRAAKTELPMIEKTIVENIQAKAKAFIESLIAETGLKFEAPDMKVIHQGHGISFHVSGAVEGFKLGLKRIAGVSREASRFIHLHKAAGLTKSILDKEVTFKDLLSEEKPVTGKWKVIGLKGAKMDVVVENEKAERLEVRLADFKEKHQVVSA